VQEHEFAPAVEPQKEQPNPQTNDHHRRRQRHNPVQIAQDIVLGVLKLMPEVCAAAAMSTTAPPTARDMETRPTAFPQTSQPRAKADNEPFAEVERLEQHALHPLQRRADGFDHVDFHRSGCHRLNRVHRYQILFQPGQAEKYILKRKL